MQKIIDTYFPLGCPVVDVPEEINRDNYISVFPNPNSGQFTVSLPEDSDQITVSDIRGQQVLTLKATRKTINLQLDNSGVYIISVKTKRGTATGKIIVNR